MKNIFIIYLMLVTFGNNNEKIYYHLWRPTASMPVVTQWDITPSDSIKFYIIEKVDSLNRVKEIKFMNGDSIYTKFTFLECPIIKYNYLENQIIETRYYGENNFVDAYESGWPYKVIYFIDNDNYIVDMKFEYFIDTTLYKNINYEKEINELKNRPPGDTQVWYYYYSISRYNGIIPTVKGFNTENVHKPYIDPPPSTIKIERKNRADN